MNDSLTRFRWFSIALCVMLLAMLCVDGGGIYCGCPLSDRLTYPFLHASLIHCAVNVWCFLAIVFYYDISWWQLVTAYLIAISFPSPLLSSTPTVGFSGVCYALVGIQSLRVAKPLTLLAWMLIFIAVGFLFPGANAWVHLYCYAVGWIVALLTTPLSLWTRR